MVGDASNERSPVRSVASSVVFIDSTEVELARIAEREVSLPFDEDNSDHKHIGMQAVITPLLCLNASRKIQIVFNKRRKTD
jgi:hypothetical protein